MELVQIENGQIYADSLKVAMAFGKNHRDVLRRIEILIVDISALKNDESIERKIALYSKHQENQNEINGRETELVNEVQKNQYELTERKIAPSAEKFFIESKYKATNGKLNKCYLMTQDGFSLLVMGFTGQKALEWKLKYIEAFNYMRESLNRVRELSIVDYKELEKIKGSAKSIVHIEKELRKDMKEMEQIIRRIGDRNAHLYAYGTQILDMSKDIEQGKLRDINEY